MKKLLVAIGLMALVGCSTGFSSGDISRIEDEIKMDYYNRGLSPSKVKLFKQGPNLLVGSAEGFYRGSDGVNVPDWVVQCQVYLVPENKSYQWQCR